jgi:hypothetical protein
MSRPFPYGANCASQLPQLVVQLTPPVLLLALNLQEHPKSAAIRHFSKSVVLTYENMDLGVGHKQLPQPDSGGGGISTRTTVDNCLTPLALYCTVLVSVTFCAGAILQSCRHVCLQYATADPCPCGNP